MLKNIIKNYMEYVVIISEINFRFAALKCRKKIKIHYRKIHF